MKFTLLENIYLRLLQHPHDAWRTQNQALYVEVREALVKETGLTSQEVQEHYESVAAMLKTAPALEDAPSSPAELLATASSTEKILLERCHICGGANH